MTTGEYRWSSTYDGESIDALSHTFVFAGPNSDENIGHVGGVDDVDEDGDYDDFGFYRINGNGSGGAWYLMMEFMLSYSTKQHAIRRRRRRW